MVLITSGALNGTGDGIALPAEPRHSFENMEGRFAMTRDDIVQLLNHTAASLLSAAPSIPGKANDLRCIAARLQIVSMDIEDMEENRGMVLQFAARR
jgi:hypothetical protein